MKPKYKIHFMHDGAALCEQAGTAKATRNWDKVTCRRCLMYKPAKA